MTRSSVVVGCDAVDAGPDWLRLHTPEGLRTIAWNTIQMAATPVNDGKMTFEGEFEQITALRDTHDPLWIESADGVMIAMLEKKHPKRDSILNMFKERLGTCWIGDRITAMEAAERMFSVPQVIRGGGRGFPKLMIIMIAAALLMIVLAIVVSHFAR